MWPFAKRKDDPATVVREMIVPFCGHTVVIRELSLRKFSQLSTVLDGVANLKEVFEKLGSGETLKVAEGVSDLMRTVPEALAQVVHIATDLPADKVMDATPTQVVELLAHIVGINDLGDLLKKKVPSLGLVDSPTKPT